MNRKELESWDFFLLMAVQYLFIFEFFLMQIIDFAKYWDEFYALMSVLLFASKFKGKIERSNDTKIIMALFLYLAIGFLSNLIYQYQTATAVITDILLNVKFYLGIYTTLFLFQKFDYKKYLNQIKWHIDFIVLTFSVLILIDEIFCIFPCHEIRYGIRSEELFYGHPTGLASVAYFLLLMQTLLLKRSKKDLFFLMLTLLLICSTLRAKALAASVVYLFLYFWIIILKRKVSVWNMVFLVPIIICIAWEQIYGYYFTEAGMESARTALAYKSISIMRDYFPIGTGMGTFASAPSGEWYSPIYGMYDLSSVWGLSADFSAFVSDSFWPMVIGQTGFLGTLLYLRLLSILLKKIGRAYYINKHLYLAGMGAVAYLFVSSTAESAFVNPLSLPLAFIIGLVFIELKKSRENYQ